MINGAPTALSGTLPDWTKGRDYGTRSLTTTGGTAPFVWTVTGLPTGLSSTPGGREFVVSGTPTVAGTYAVKVKVTDAAGSTQTFDDSIVIHAALSKPAGTLPDWTIGIAYATQELTTTGGTDPVAWTVTGLPPGLHSTASGRTLSIEGTPVKGGEYSVVVTAGDSAGDGASVTFPVFINSPPTAATGSLSDWSVGRPYPTATLSTTGGTEPIAWTVVGLPPGLSWSAVAGVLTITGTPTAAGKHSVTLTATDASGATATRDIEVTINAALSTPAGALPHWTAGRSYPESRITTTGGTEPLSWTAQGVPPGLSASGSGRTLTVSGLPTSPGTYAVTARVTDAAGTTATWALTVVISKALTSPSGDLPDWTVGRDYGVRDLITTGGTEPIRWTVVGLPKGLTWSPGTRTCAIEGTPTEDGLFLLFVLVEDAAGSSAFALRLLDVNEGIAAPEGELPEWTVGRPYGDRAITVAGGTDPVQWTWSGLPPGLAATASGRTLTIKGTPASAGTFDVELGVADTAGDDQSRTIRVKINESLSIDIATLPPWTIGRPFTQAFAAVGGTPPFSWELLSGGAPGLAFDPDGATYAGTPTADGTFFLGIRVTDAAGDRRKATYEFLMNPTVALPDKQLLYGTAGSPYSDRLDASGGTSPYVFSVTSGDLPPGCALLPATGEVRVCARITSGFEPWPIAGSAGACSRGKAAEASEGCIPPSFVAPRRLPVRVGSSSRLAGRAHRLSRSWELIPAQTLTGTPAAQGGYVFEVTFTDAAGAVTTRSYTLQIADLLDIAGGTVKSTTVVAGRGLHLLGFDALQGSSLTLKMARPDKQGFTTSTGGGLTANEVRLVDPFGGEIALDRPLKVKGKKGLTVGKFTVPQTGRLYLLIDNLPAAGFSFNVASKVKYATKFKVPGTLNGAGPAVIPFAAPKGATVQISVKAASGGPTALRFARVYHVESQAALLTDAAGPKATTPPTPEWGAYRIELTDDRGGTGSFTCDIKVKPAKKKKRKR